MSNDQDIFQNNNATAKRIRGRTSTQITILAVLVIFAFSVGVMGCSSSKTPPAKLMPLPTRTVGPSATPGPQNALPTFGATSTIEPPTETLTPTPQVAEAAPDGWKKFETSGAELWLPSSFVGGDLVNNRNKSINAVRNLGATYSMAYEAMSQADSTFVLWMVDKTQVSDFTIPTVFLVTETVADTDLDTYVAQSISSGNLFVSEQKKLTLLGLETRRLLVQTKLYAHDFSAWIYIVKDGDRFWIIFYEAGIGSFYDMQSVFEQSVRTFNLLK